MSVAVAVSRRTFLYGSALAAGAVAISACSGGGGSGRTQSGGGRSGGTVGSASRPLPTPASLHDSPTLKGLPPVHERLPKQPLVLPHRWVEPGHYGGSMTVPVFGTTGMANATSSHQFFYGHSPARFLNDGLDIGPGIAQSWSSNKNATVWTVRFREGLRWSDGELFTVDDVIFWYEDIAVAGHNGQVVPKDCLSAKGTPCRMTKVDDSTLKIAYDSPQPILPDYLAMNPKGNIGAGAAPWLYPKHYLKQFHPKYNKDVPKDWDTAGGLWEQKADWIRNPDCPTLTGFKCKSFDNNSGIVLERNPYYYVVSKEGNQLPYLDTIRFKLFQNPEVIKLQVQQGAVDYCQGNFNQIDLSDVSALTRSRDQGHYRILLWDSGSGTGPVFFLNFDYPDKKYRDLFNDKRFRQAISYGYDRKTLNKALFFQMGELTTGTMSPKTPSFHAKPSGPDIYKQWRNAYNAHDPGQAKSLLAAIGLKDADGDGYLEFPDGSKLTVEIPYSADISTTYGAADDQLVSDMKEIGLRMVRRPIPPQSYQDAWAAGGLMAHTNWEVGGVPSVLAQPEWLVPVEASRWAPLQGMWYAQRSTGKNQTETKADPWKRHPPRREPAAGSPVAKLTATYNQVKFEADTMKREKLIWDIMKIHIDEGPFFIGSTASYPQVTTVHSDLRNVPSKENLAQGGWVNPANIPAPAVYDPECYFWTNPDDHR
ncbi:MAG TPA: ABC transporter substrate-binding protein [Mycobacteriales bacterium]|nr:ABC transporter substrate-binding protein [Mycobacteriales bacterium]